MSGNLEHSEHLNHPVDHPYSVLSGDVVSLENIHLGELLYISIVYIRN